MSLKQIVRTVNLDMFKSLVESIESTGKKYGIVFYT